MNNNDLVAKLWKLCDSLRGGGVSYQDRVNKLTSSLFLKMYKGTGQKAEYLPEGHHWDNLKSRIGQERLQFRRKVLIRLGEDDKKLVQVVFHSVNTTITGPKQITTLISNMDSLDWYNGAHSKSRNGLGDMCEGLPQENANETKFGTGQYLTPCPLIKTVIHPLRPQPHEMVQDPAAGTTGFLIEAGRYVESQANDLDDLDDDTQDFQIHRMSIGLELVPGIRRLVLMNCLPHDIEGNLNRGGVIRLGNALSNDGENLPEAHIVTTNPPFSSAAGTNVTHTFVHPTGSKQLCFIQHIIGTLHPGGCTAMVVSDNILFEDGKDTDIRRGLVNECHLRTILYLSTGIFYAQGAKTNVLLFTKGTVANPNQDKNRTDGVWVYDLRTSMPSFGKRTPFTDRHLQPFERVHGEDPHGLSLHTEGEQGFSTKETEVTDSEENRNTDQHLATSRWCKLGREQIHAAKSDPLDVSWLKDKDSIDADSLPGPDVLAAETVGELIQALSELDALIRELGASDEANLQCQLLEEAFGGIGE